LNRISLSKKTVIFMLVVIIFAALLLRIFNIGHVLAWDEAWNVHSIVDAATGNTSDVFFKNFWRHPPLYLGCGILVEMLSGASRFGLAYVMEFISLTFSIILLFLVFLCAKDWFGDIAALASSFAFAVMPAARIFDTWIKQESMTLVFCLLYLLFFFRKKYIVAGLCLGVALLTKEICVFIPVGLFLFLIISRSFGKLKEFSEGIAVAVVISAWWYLFFASSTGQFIDFFFGKHESAKVFWAPWYLFWRRLPQDFGWIILVFAGIGLLSIIWRLKARGIKREGELEEVDYGLLMAIIFFVVYLVMTVSYGKPPWLAYSAFPFFAILAGFGFSLVLNALTCFRIHFVVVVLVLTLALSIIVGYNSFMMGADVTFSGGLVVKRASEYVNKEIGEKGKIMLSAFDVSPVLFFYLKNYSPGGMVTLERNIEPESAMRIYSKYNIFLLDKGTTPIEAANLISVLRPSFLLVRYRPGYRGKNATYLAVSFASLIKPKKIGSIWLFDLRDYYGGDNR